MKKSWILFVCAATALGAAEIMDLNTPAAWANPKAVKVKDGVVTVNPGSSVSAKTFPVDMTKTYTISGEFRCPVAAGKGRLLLGFRPLTADGRDIKAPNVETVSSKIGTLAAPVAKGDKVVKIKGVSSWKVNQAHYMLAMNAKEDCKDLPNYDLSPLLVKGAGKPAGSDVLEFELQKPFEKAYPAGTAVRLHAHGEVHIFVGNGINPLNLGSQWTKFTGKVAAKKGRDIRAWYPGTAKARAALYPNWGLQKVEFRNLKVTAE